jgi:hypothetical protein
VQRAEIGIITTSPDHISRLLQAKWRSAYNTPFSPIAVQRHGSGVLAVGVNTSSCDFG